MASVVQEPQVPLVKVADCLFAVPELLEIPEVESLNVQLGV